MTMYQIFFWIIVLECVIIIAGHENEKNKNDDLRPEHDFDYKKAERG